MLNKITNQQTKKNYLKVESFITPFPVESVSRESVSGCLIVTVLFKFTLSHHDLKTLIALDSFKFIAPVNYAYEPVFKIVFNCGKYEQ